MDNNHKKIAVFHNFVDNIGGAEIVALNIARSMDADLYTTNIDIEKIKKMGFEDVLPRIKSIGKVPKTAPFKQQIALWRFRKLNLGSQYNFYIIAGDWAMSGAVNNKPNLWYIHSPLNELWQFKKFIKENLLSWWKKPIFDVWVLFNRILTRKYSKHVEKWVCNSNNTKNRVAKFYKKDALVIHPPTNINDHYTSPSKDYWLSVSRFVVHKRLDVQMLAFEKLPKENLILIASYEKDVPQFEQYKNKIESMKPDNVEILHWTDQNRLIEMYSECKGFITTAKDEDFGMTVVEAMASGKPVIAPHEGGYLESVVHGETGALIQDINSDKLANTIEKISTELEQEPLKYESVCRERAESFGIDRFIEKLKEEINR